MPNTSLRQIGSFRHGASARSTVSIGAMKTSTRSLRSYRQIGTVRADGAAVNESEMDIGGFKAEIPFDFAQIIRPDLLTVTPTLYGPTITIQSPLVITPDLIEPPSGGGGSAVDADAVSKIPAIEADPRYPSRAVSSRRTDRVRLRYLKQAGFTTRQAWTILRRLELP